MSSGVLIIAEAGVNHNGSLARAKDLVAAAAAVGADVVKFQSFSAEKLSTKTAPVASYQRESMRESQSQHAMLQKLELSWDEQVELSRNSRDQGIEFLSSAFDADGIEDLIKLGVKRLKVPSGEITNKPYLRAVGRQGMHILLSTGMCSLGEVEEALLVLEGAGANRNNISVLQCNTAYPTPLEDVNLLAMLTMKEAFKTNIGYSDHTLGIEVALASVALGATVIEKHLTLDKDADGPDHKASLDPTEFRSMVSGIRSVEKALGSGIKLPSSSELKNIEVARKSVVAARDISEGEIFSEENLTTKRPASGLSPMSWDSLLGRPARRSYLEDDFIEW